VERRWFGRLALRGAVWLLGGGFVRVAAGAGAKLRLSSDHLPYNHAQGHGLIRGVLEPEVQEALRRHVFLGAVVYDVGANLGFFTILSARLTGPDGRVDAFEPVPQCADAVRANAALNGFGAVHVHELAAGEHDRDAELLVPGEHAWAHLADRGRHWDTRYAVTVPVRSLDALIASGELPPPDVIKLDVEGSEIAVLRGLAQTLRAHAVVVVCELHETNAEVLALMESLGYTVENLEGPEPVADAGPVHVLIRPGVGR
jgi:FkbM family methyltransferase